MSVSTNQRVGSRVISAFFDTTGAARKATDDLVAAGIPREHISQTGGQAADAQSSGTGDHRGFWDQLKDFFLPEGDHASYGEGLRRGGVLLAVRADEANYNRVLTIMDTDGAVDMDEREGQWREEGWSGAPDRANLLGADAPAAGLMTGSTLSAGASALAVPNDNRGPAESAYDTWRSDDVARAAALDGSVPATAGAARTAARDDSHGLKRLRSYVLSGDDQEQGEASPGSFSPRTDAARIVEHMQVISADGQTIGTVDHLDGPDRIKLTKNASPDGQHHIVPFTWIDHVDQHVHLRKTLAEIKAGQ